MAMEFVVLNYNDAYTTTDQRGDIRLQYDPSSRSSLPEELNRRLLQSNTPLHEVLNWISAEGWQLSQLKTTSSSVVIPDRTDDSGDIIYGDV
jgi:hypothetical protein